jgi:hypothetical protein
LSKIRLCHARTSSENLEHLLQIKNTGKRAEGGEVIRTKTKITLLHPIRSAKAGVGIVPLEGELVIEVESLGREMLLVKFGEGVTEYVFPNEVKVKEAA